MKKAYGGVVINPEGKVLLREPSGHYNGHVWTFAKGGPIPGESPEQTALREVLEETGVRANIVKKIPGSFDGSTTSNEYFLMAPVEDTKQFDAETVAITWATRDEAKQLIGLTVKPRRRRRDLRVLKIAFRLFCSLACQCFGQSAPAPIPHPAGPPTKLPVSGKTNLPPLSREAQRVQERFCASLCRNLERAASEARVYVDSIPRQESLRYRLFKPAECDPSRTYPLVLSLHGGGASRKFEDLLTCASPVFAFGPARLVSPQEQARHPAFVLVPWSGGRDWDQQNIDLIVGLLGALRREFPIDPKRLYVTGQSMGGYGTWQLLSQHPELFAAAIPVCGGGDPASVSKAKNVAVWVFHGSKDGIVPVSESRKMVDALVAAGGKPIYWEYQAATHAATAQRAYSEPALLDWLFAQARP